VGCLGRRPIPRNLRLFRIASYRPFVLQDAPGACPRLCYHDAFPHASFPSPDSTLFWAVAGHPSFQPSFFSEPAVFFALPGSPSFDRQKIKSSSPQSHPFFQSSKPLFPLYIVFFHEICEIRPCVLLPLPVHYLAHPSYSQLDLQEIPSPTWFLLSFALDLRCSHFVVWRLYSCFVESSVLPSPFFPPYCTKLG